MYRSLWNDLKLILKKKAPHVVWSRSKIPGSTPSGLLPMTAKRHSTPVTSGTEGFNTFEESDVLLLAIIWIILLHASSGILVASNIFVIEWVWYNGSSVNYSPQLWCQLFHIFLLLQRISRDPHHIAYDGNNIVEKQIEFLIWQTTFSPNLQESLWRNSLMAQGVNAHWYRGEFRISLKKIVT